MVYAFAGGATEYSGIRDNLLEKGCTKTLNQTEPTNFY
jgi:hypothetical protein